MFVMFDKECPEFVVYGDTLEKVINEWESETGTPVDYASITVVQGVEKKFKIDLVDAKPKVVPKAPAKKPAAKSAAKK